MQYQYHNANNQGLRIFFLLLGTFSGPIYPDNQGMAVQLHTHHLMIFIAVYILTVFVNLWVATSLLPDKNNVVTTNYLST